MTEEMQRLALAKWEGLKVVDIPLIPNQVDRKGSVFTPAAKEALRRAYPQATIKLLPTYTSLDDLHRIEERLTDEEHEMFRSLLWDITYPKGRIYQGTAHSRAYASASAEQRRTALIRALNLWTESHE
jgi:hypothetical protein